MPSLSELYTASDSDPAPVVEFVRGVAEAYALPQPLRVLDAGCGPGRLLGPLARLGWEVTGLEPLPEFAAAAREVARSSRRVEVVPGGFLDVDGEDAFDLVIAVNSSFAHLVSPAERAEALERIHRALRPGGVVCLDLPNFLWILTHYREPEPFTFTARGNAVTMVRRHEIDVQAATFTTTDEYRLEGEAGPHARMVHAYAITTLPEIRHHLHLAGFTEPRAYAGYGSPADERLRGPRMIVAARKPEG